MTRSLPWMICLLLTVQVCAAQNIGAEAPLDGAEIQQTVRDVLADPEFRHLFVKHDEKPETSQEMPQWLRDWLKWLFGEDASRSSAANPLSGFGDIIFYLFIGVLVVLLIVVIVSLMQRMAPATAEDSIPELDEEAINPSQPPGDRPANEYERRALAAAEAGDYRSALRELVLGSMSWTERAGLIRFRRGLTNRDYIRAVWRLEPRRDSLLQIVAAFERVFYGRRVADAATFNDCLQEFRNSFATEAHDASLAR